MPLTCDYTSQQMSEAIPNVGSYVWPGCKPSVVSASMDNFSAGLLSAARAGVKTGLVAYHNLLQQQNKLIL